MRMERLTGRSARLPGTRDRAITIYLDEYVFSDHPSNVSILSTFHLHQERLRPHVDNQDELNRIGAQLLERVEGLNGPGTQQSLVSLFTAQTHPTPYNNTSGYGLPTPAYTVLPPPSPAPPTQTANRNNNPLPPGLVVGPPGLPSHVSDAVSEVTGMTGIQTQISRDTAHTSSSGRYRPIERYIKTKQRVRAHYQALFRKHGGSNQSGHRSVAFTRICKMPGCKFGIKYVPFDKDNLWFQVHVDKFVATHNHGAVLPDDEIEDDSSVYRATTHSPGVFVPAPPTGTTLDSGDCLPPSGLPESLKDWIFSFHIKEG
jgi:hypothetical protein